MFESKVDFLKREFKMWCEKLERNLRAKENIQLSNNYFYEQINKKGEIISVQEKSKIESWKNQIENIDKEIWSCEAYLIDIVNQLEFYDKIKARFLNLDLK